MNYFKMRAKYVVCMVIFAPKKADGSRDISSIHEIAKCNTEGDAALLREAGAKKWEHVSEVGYYTTLVVMTTDEAKQFKEAAI